MPGDSDGWFVVPTGKTPSHQQPGISGSNSGREDLLEESSKQTSTTVNGQSDSSSLRKQFGRDCLRPGNENGQRIVDVVLRKRDSSDGTTPTGKGQRLSGHRVEGHERPLRLQAKPVDFPTGNVSLPVSRSRSVCNKTDLPSASLLQLETGSAGRGDGCFPPGLERLCQSSLESNRESTSKSGASESRCNPDSSSQPWYPRLLGLLVASPLRIDPQEEVMETERQPDLVPPLAVRQHYTSQRLSAGATDLLLSSWRSQSYE